jgi:plasmid stabilization system protein ParE
VSRARFSPRAERDLDEIFQHIAGENPVAAERVHRTILNTSDFPAQHTELGRRIRKASPRLRQIRWFVVPRLRNYLIFYQPVQETIVVVRVLHAAQDWTRSFSTS